MATKRNRNPANHFAHILPFPAFPVVSAPSMIAAEAGIYRSALTLSFAFWLSGCRPLPRDTTSLAALARLPAGNLVPARAKLDAVLSELLPMLAEEYDRQFKSRARILAVTKYAASISNRNQRAKREKAPATAQSISTPRIHPTIKPPHQNARTDMAARTAATERQTTAANPGPRESPFKVPSRTPHRPQASPAHHTGSHGGMLSEAGHAGRK
jgi:hypothetical protein